MLINPRDGLRVTIPPYLVILNSIDRLDMILFEPYRYDIFFFLNNDSYRWFGVLLKHIFSSYYYSRIIIHYTNRAGGQ